MPIVHDPLQKIVSKVHEKISFLTESYIEWCLNELGVDTKDLKNNDKSLSKFSKQMDENKIEVTSHRIGGTVSYNIFKDGIMEYQFGYFITKDYNVHFDIIGLGPKWLEDGVNKN